MPVQRANASTGQIRAILDFRARQTGAPGQNGPPPQTLEQFFIERRAGAGGGQNPRAGVAYVEKSLLPGGKNKTKIYHGLH